MSILKDFTEAVVKDESEKLGISVGYEVKDRKPYTEYMSNKAWSEFKRKMSTKHIAEFGKGSGSEMDDSPGNVPKMSSMISSSRMIFMLSKEIDGFSFEAKRHTVVGGEANLDGYLYREDRIFYVESKCREPYNHETIEELSVKYQAVLDYLRKKRNAFDCVMEKISDCKLRVAFFCDGKPVLGFDIKQMICHLLGIAAYHLRAEEDPKPITFLYLLYDPRKLVFPEKTSAEILRIYEKTCQAALGYRFEEMFGYIIDYLVDVKNLPGKHRETLKRVFTFELCSQYDYHSKF